MPRSSGQNAIPQRAIAFDCSPISSRSSKRTDPVRWPTIPMIDLSVVVLPAPLRPSSVTTSPARTSNVTPCRMWDSPYQACRFSTASSGVPDASGMPDSHIGFAHLRIVRDSLVVPLRQNPAAGEHRDAIGQVRDDAEIVLDHQHGAVEGDRFDQSGDPLDVLVAHAGG